MKLSTVTGTVSPACCAEAGLRQSRRCASKCRRRSTSLTFHLRSSSVHAFDVRQLPRLVEERLGRRIGAEHHVRIRAWDRSAPSSPPCRPAPSGRSRHRPSRRRSSASRDLRRAAGARHVADQRVRLRGHRPSPTSIARPARSPARSGDRSCRRRTHCRPCP